jgi:hypothetical protein
MIPNFPIVSTAFLPAFHFVRWGKGRKKEKLAERKRKKFLEQIKLIHR